MPVFFATRGFTRECDSRAHNRGDQGQRLRALSLSSSTQPRPTPASSPVVDRFPHPPRTSSLQTFFPPDEWMAKTPARTSPRTPRRYHPVTASPHSRGVTGSPKARDRWCHSQPEPLEDETGLFEDGQADHSPYQSRLATHDAPNIPTTPTYRSLLNTRSYRSLDPYLEETHDSLLDADATADAEAGHMPAAVNVLAEYSASPDDPYAVSSPGSMRRASPMPQAMPATYFPSSAPWQYATTQLSSPTDAAPSTGKTSQVLAKLTAECDRLRREIKAEKAAREDAVQQMQAVKGRVDWLEDKNSTLQMQLDASENALARKDRRLVDMKATFDEAVARRKRAEDREAEMGRKLGDTVSQAAREVSEAHTAQKAAENAYTTLENEYTGLQKRITFLKKEVELLTQKINQNNIRHREQFTKLEVLLDLQRHQQEKSDRQVMEMGALLRGYRETEENTKRLEEELRSTVDEMRWVMQLQTSREGGEPVAVRRQVGKPEEGPIARSSLAKVIAKANTGNKMRKSEVGLVS